MLAHLKTVLGGAHVLGKVGKNVPFGRPGSVTGGVGGSADTQWSTKLLPENVPLAIGVKFRRK